MEVKKIGALSVAKIAGIFGVLMGLVAAILIVLLANYAPEAMAQIYGSKTMDTSTAIMLPFIYGTAYFLAGLIGAALYNLFARWVGGIKIELKK